MTTADNVKRAEALTRIGLWVFPVYVRPDPENPYKNSKKPGTANGFYDATNDPGYVSDLFERHPKAEVGVWMGPSGLNAADIDVKRDPEGKILVDGFEEFDKSWLPLPETHSFDSISGAGGKQFIYAAPEGKNLGPAGKYRGIEGVDRRAGNSYSVWVGDVPTSRDVFTEAPEWLNDEATVRSASIFEGDVKAWYETLEPGEPSLIVRAAMDRTREVFESAGNDFDHAAMIERQFEAVRLGAEGHPGVDQLLALIEELFLSRTGSHSRSEQDWEYEFRESLASAVEKYGDAISLRKDLPTYTPSLVPAGIPDRLFLGAPGRKADFTALLRALQDSTDDDLVVTSVLWNAPKTKDMAREWGLEFCYKRVQDARLKPEPVKENPSLEPSDKNVTAAPRQENVTSENPFMSTEEVAVAESTHTFIDTYLAASLKKGFNVPSYDIPSAWTALSMAFGTKAVLSYNGLGTNMWFIKMGNTGTGKAQPLHSQVLTPFGFRNMSEIRVGDQVVLPSGGSASVSGVFPQGERPVYVVTLADGRQVEADSEHLWSVTNRMGKARTKTTAELMTDLYDSRGSYKWFIEAINPVDLGASWESVIDPYSLGVIIGDGSLTSSSLSVTNSNAEIVEHFEVTIPSEMKVVTKKNRIQLSTPGSGRWKRHPWMEELRSMGLWGKNSAGKFIPENLLYSPVSDRISLLQGLFDTDGSPAKSGNSLEFSTASIRMADQVAWLVRSLGGRATISTKDVTLKGWTESRTYYRLHIALPRFVQPFRLARKAKLINAGGKYDITKFSIRSIEFKGYEETQCIMVDHPDHEYITDGFTRTHNTQSHTFGKAVLDLTMKENDSYYNVGASSSPAAIHEELLMRDGKASMILHDEAASFFSDLANQEWSKTLEHHFSSFYDGEVEPSNKVRLPKELRGKHARTSFGLNMSATPDKLLSLLNTGMFESGFLSRVNWTWTPDRAENDDIFRMGPSNVDANVRTHPAVYDLAADLRSAGESIPDGSIIGATPEAWERLSQAAKDMYTHSKGKERFETLKGPLTRLRETSVKCAALLAMYRGETTFTLTDALVAIRYVSEWYESMVRVVNETSESDFSRDCNEIESYVRLQGEVSGAKLNHRFRSLIKRSPRELSDRIDFLVESGRLISDRGTGSTIYRING